MKNFTLISILFLFSFISYSQTSSLDIHAKLNQWVDNPESFVSDIIPFKIVCSGSTVSQYCKRMYENSASIINNSKARNEFAISFVENFAFNTLLYGPIMFEGGKMLNTFAPIETMSTDAIKYCLDGTEYINKIKARGGCKYSISDEQLQHIKDRHFPIGKSENKSQHLFLQTDLSELFPMMEEVLSQNKMSISKYNGLAIFKGKLKSKSGVMREFLLIVNPKTGFIETFYPCRALTPEQLIKAGFSLEYTKQ